MSIQNIVGKTSEDKIANFLRENGYWAYILPKKVGGQPFDVIACKNNIIWFVDSKHLEKDKASFPFERIEPNQKTSMLYALKFANIQNLGFVIMWERNPNILYFLHFLKWQEMDKNGEKSIKIEELEDFGEVINEHNYSK